MMGVFLFLHLSEKPNTSFTLRKLEKKRREKERKKERERERKDTSLEKIPFLVFFAWCQLSRLQAAKEACLTCSIQEQTETDSAVIGTFRMERLMRKSC